MFKGIKQLLPGHALTIENGKVKTWRYWDVKFDMSLYVYPSDSGEIQKFLKKRLTQLHSERSINAEK
ncbi:MAG: hypothetical protein ACPHY8_02310 [Patescibacteria group bacterium]